MCRRSAVGSATRIDGKVCVVGNPDGNDVGASAWLRPVDSERLRLCPARVEHADAYADAAEDSSDELSRWSKRGPRDRASYVRKALERAVSTTLGTFVLRHAFTRALPERLVGGVTIQRWCDPRQEQPDPAETVRVDESRDLEVGYWCRTSETGQGYASEAVSAVVAHAFADLQASAVWLRIARDNVRSLRLADRLGFSEIDRVTFPASPEWGGAATVSLLQRLR
jgi:RimJ/RimL family protein N-acetyltransferase